MNFKIIALALLMSGSALCFGESKTVYLPKSMVGTLAPANTVFLWDFHDVIVKRDKKKTLGALWHADKWKIVRNTSFELLRKMIGMIGSSKTSSEEFIQLVQKSKNPPLEKLIMRVAVQQKPIKSTIQLIKTLSQNGYTHYLGSNIGDSIFRHMNDPKKYPKFASIFKNFNLENPQTVTFDPMHPEQTLKKPDIRFFHQFLTKNNIDLQTKNVVFIDDNAKNVCAACKAGMIGIQFIHPHQLKADLKKLGIKVE